MSNPLPSVAHGPEVASLGIQKIQLNRRELLQLGVSAGLVLGFAPLALAKKDEDAAPSLNSLNTFVSIGSDNQVHIVAHRSEMGQGIRTGLPQVLADEMEADWQMVHIVQATGDKKYGNQNTDGSRSVRHFYQKMRELGATAKWLLEEAAAKQWQVPHGEVRAKSHKVTHLSSGKSLSFGELAEAAGKLEAPSTEQLKLKSKEDFNYIGKGLSPVDNRAIIEGTAVYGIDVALPEMVYASIERCPVIGGKLKSLDASAAKSQKGVIDVITIPENSFPIGFQPLHGVAVVASNSWAAEQARKQLKIEWDFGSNKDYSSQEEAKQLLEKVKQPGTVNNQMGDFSAAEENAAQVFEATYSVPYLAHAPMEPPAATASVTEQGCELWVCTQAPQTVQKEVSGLLALKPEQVTVNVTLLGGAFGRKAKADFANEAALLSQKLKRPVKVTWTREDDIRSGYFHAISAQYFKACIGSNKRLTGWLQRTAFPSIMSLFSSVDAPPAGWELDLGFSEMPVSTDNLQSEFHAVPAHVRIGWVRSVCNIHHAFARCSFIDELAQKLDKPAPIYWLQVIGNAKNFDPKSAGYQYGNYGEPLDQYPIEPDRLKNVVKQAARKGRWSKQAKGEGWGLAAHRSFLSYVAVASKVKVENNKVRVEEVHIVIDCGLAVNPDRVRSQMEGSVIFGLSLALMGEITMENGQVAQSNFNDYPLLRLDQTPKIEVTIIESDAVPGGVGEPGVPPVAPSITNAIFAAGGPRIRDLPINKHMDV